MYSKMRILKVLSGASFAACLLLQQTSSAQSARSFLRARGNPAKAPSSNSNCKRIRGNSLQLFDPVTGVVSGPVTNSGILDGSLEDIINFAAGFVFTPDPNILAYTTDLTVTTQQGQLRLSPVTIQSVVTGDGSEWGSIDPTTSTGRFAGATGTLSVVFKLAGDPSVGPWEADITADICFAQ